MWSSQQLQNARVASTWPEDGSEGIVLPNQLKTTCDELKVGSEDTLRKHFSFNICKVIFVHMRFVLHHGLMLHLQVS